MPRYGEPPVSFATGGSPYLGIEAFTCPDGGVWASTYTSVVPPDELVVEDHLLFVMWDTLVDDAVRREALAQRGLPVFAGSVEIRQLAAPAPSTEALFRLEGVGAFTMRALDVRPGSPFEGDFIEWMEAEDGTLAAWRTHYAAATMSSGPVVVEVPAGSWMAEVLGGTRAEGSAISGTWSFTNGSIRVPAR